MGARLTGETPAKGELLGRKTVRSASVTGSEPESTRTPHLHRCPLPPQGNSMPWPESALMSCAPTRRFDFKRERLQANADSIAAHTASTMLSPSVARIGFAGRHNQEMRPRPIRR